MAWLENPLISRIALAIGLVILLFMAPAWLTFCLAFIPIFFFKRYIEFLFVGVFLDLVYQTGEHAFVWGLFYTLLAVVLYVASQLIKQKLFVYYR